MAKELNLPRVLLYATYEGLRASKFQLLYFVCGIVLYANFQVFHFNLVDTPFFQDI
jgi:hypothetical protein